MCSMVSDGEADVLGFDVKTLPAAIIKARKDISLATNLLSTIARANR